jgi:hypothetical protein
MNGQEQYFGFTFTWEYPPPSGDGYQISISSEDSDLNGKAPAGAQIRPASRVLKDARQEAQRFIDGLLTRSPSSGAL